MSNPPTSASGGFHRRGRRQNDILMSKTDLEMYMTTTVVGQSVQRRGLREKLTGEARYSADLKLPGMLCGAVLRSPHAHANIISIDTSAALALPGVRAVVTPFDVPGGRVEPDVLVLDTRVRYEGDEVAAVAADDAETAAAALKLLLVEYQILPFILDAGEACRPSAIMGHI